MSIDKVEYFAVPAEELRQVLQALNGQPHLIRELQATRARGTLFGDNPIDVLGNHYIEQQQGKDNIWQKRLRVLYTKQFPADSEAKAPTFDDWCSRLDMDARFMNQAMEGTKGDAKQEEPPVVIDVPALLDAITAAVGYANNGFTSSTLDLGIVDGVPFALKAGAKNQALRTEATIIQKEVVDG